MSDFKLSVSKTKTFIDCKKKYNFTYILKMPRKEFAFHTLGKFCHKVLEDFHQLYIDGCKDPYNETFSKCFKNANVEYKDSMTPDMKKEAKEILVNYLNDLYVNDIVKKVLSVEKNFNLNIDNKVILNGMIDRIQMDDDNIIHVCDYKTTKDEKYLKNDFFQLLTYAYVLLCEDPTLEAVRGSYIMLRHGCKPITKVFPREEILAIKDKYLNYVDTILSETQYEPNPTFLCKFCDHLALCPEGQEKTNTSTVFGEVSWE